MSKIILNDRLTGINGADMLYTLPGLPQQKYTNNLADIFRTYNLTKLIVPIVAKERISIDDDFQIWRFTRVMEDNINTNNFVLSCSIEDESLLELDCDNVEVLKYEQTFLNLDLNFDVLIMWASYDTLLLPEEY